MKLCLDCKHSFIVSVTSRDRYCYAPQNKDKRVRADDLVEPQTGKRWRWDFCIIHREDGWLAARIGNTCGREGRWFEQKVTP